MCSDHPLNAGSAIDGSGLLRRLNRAALAGYQQFIKTDVSVGAHETTSSRNNRFFEWQTRGTEAGVNLGQLPLSASDKTTLHDIAVR